MYFSTSFIPYISQYTKSVPKYKGIGSPSSHTIPFSTVIYLALIHHSLHGIFSTPLPNFQFHQVKPWTLGWKGKPGRELLPSITKTERKNCE